MVCFTFLLLSSKPSWANFDYDHLLEVTQINEIMSHIGKISFPCRNYIFEQVFGKLFEPHEINNIKMSVNGNKYKMSFKARGKKIKVEGTYSYKSGIFHVTIDKAKLAGLFSVNVRDKVIDCFRDSEDPRFGVTSNDDIIIRV